MGKKVILLMFTFFLISSVSADLGTFQQGSNVIVKANINANNVNVSVYFPNSSIAINNQPMTQQAGDLWNYTFSSTNTLGEYSFFYCKVDGTSCVLDTFDISYSGLPVTTSQSILYFSLIIVFLFTFCLLILGINQLPLSNETDEEGKILSISYLKYLRPVGWFTCYIIFVGILYLSSNLAFAYLNEQLFANILFVLFRISFMMSPLILTVWVAWIFVEMFHDRQFQEMLNRGVFPQKI